MALFQQSLSTSFNVVAFTVSNIQWSLNQSFCFYAVVFVISRDLQCCSPALAKTTVRVLTFNSRPAGSICHAWMQVICEVPPTAGFSAVLRARMVRSMATKLLRQRPGPYERWVCFHKRPRTPQNRDVFVTHWKKILPCCQLTVSHQKNVNSDFGRNRSKFTERFSLMHSSFRMSNTKSRTTTNDSRFQCDAVPLKVYCVSNHKLKESSDWKLRSHHYLFTNVRCTPDSACGSLLFYKASGGLLWKVEKECNRSDTDWHQ